MSYGTEKEGRVVLPKEWRKRLESGRVLLKNLSEIYELITTKEVIEEAKSVRKELLDAIMDGLVKVGPSLSEGLPPHIRLKLVRERSPAWSYVRTSVIELWTLNAY